MDLAFRTWKRFHAFQISSKYLIWSAACLLFFKSWFMSILAPHDTRNVYQCLGRRVTLAALELYELGMVRGVTLIEPLKGTKIFVLAVLLRSITPGHARSVASQFC